MARQNPVRHPRVSIIVNNFNYERYVGAAIESALAQRYPHVDVIVVDDGSTDGSRQVIDRYAGQARILFKPNAGQASAFNAGFAASSGDYVLFLDADDVLLPDAMDVVMAAAVRNPRASKIQYRMAIVDEHGRQTGAITPSEHLPRVSGDVSRQVVTSPYDMTWMATSANVFSAAALRAIMPVPEHVYGRVGADWYVGFLTPLLGEVEFLDDVGALYRVHQSNNYQVQQPVVNVAAVRQTLAYMDKTVPFIVRLARARGVPGCPVASRDLLSVSHVANRMISLRLDPAGHPTRGDTRAGLLVQGIRAAVRRADVTPAMKLMFVLWFAAMAAVPCHLAERLAVYFLYPERRPAVNAVLGRLHRAGGAR
ncbi:MAG: glycosyltransferase family A protein [Chloroflexota bacterium]